MRSLKHKVTKSVLISSLNFDCDLFTDVEIEHVGSLDEVKENFLTFSTTILKDNVCPNGVVFVPNESAPFENFFCVSNPRLAFIKAVSWLQENIGFNDIQESVIAEGTVFGENTVIGRGVRIAKNVKIGNNVVIGDFTIVGNDVTIKSGSVIGEDGFGFERDVDGKPWRFPHLGQVVIEDYVEIGSNVTINKGTLGTTRVGRCVKIDDQVHVAHNVTIGENTLITAGAIIGGGVIIGRGVWVGLNSTFHQKKVVGDNSIVGMGANVFSDVSASSTLAGFPSRVVPK